MKIGRGLRALAVLLCLLMAMFAAACTADVPSGGSDGGSGGTEQPGGGSGNEGEGGDEGGSGDEGEGDNEGGSGNEGEGGDEGGSGSEGEGGGEGGETDPPAPQEYEISFWNEDSLYHTLTTAGNEVLTLPADPERAGYTFTGWFFDETAQTQPFDAHTYETVPLTQDEDVYAGWSLKTYTVTFYTNGGGAVAPLQTARIERADALTVPQKQGFLFAGWYLDEGLKNAVTYPYIPTGNVTFYAKWEQEPASSASFTVDEKGVLTAAEASGDVVIPERVNGVTVTQIGQRVFEKNQEITSVSLPDTVQLVGYAAFNGCKNLKTVDLGEGVQRIHDIAFQNCSALESIEFPASLRSVSSDVFKNTGLRSVSLNKVESVGDYAFAGCKQLSSLDLGVVRAFGRSVFQDCVALTEVSLPETVAGSGIELFGGCTALAKVDLPESGIALQYNAFVGTPCAAAADNRQDGLLIIDGYLFGANEKFKGTSVLTLPEGIVSVAAAAMSASYGARGVCGFAQLRRLPAEHPQHRVKGVLQVRRAGLRHDAAGRKAQRRGGGCVQGDALSAERCELGGQRAVPCELAARRQRYGDDLLYGQRGDGVHRQQFEFVAPVHGDGGGVFAEPYAALFPEGDRGLCVLLSGRTDVRDPACGAGAYRRRRVRQLQQTCAGEPRRLQRAR